MNKVMRIFVFYFMVLINYNRMYIQSELIDTSVDVDAEVAIISSYMHEWATSLSKELARLSELTRRDKVEKSFENYAIFEENWNHIREVVAGNIREMMEEKVKAVKAIKQHAELLALYRKEDITRFSLYDYYNANNLTQTEDVEDRTENIEEAEKIWKCSIPAHLNRSTTELCFDNTYASYQVNEPFAYHLTEDYHGHFNRPRTSPLLDQYSSLGWCNKIPFLNRSETYYRNMNLKYHPQFDAAVNLNYSIVRVTPTVYNREEKLLNGIRWSEALDLTFKCNFRRDPTLAYQYFGSPKGFVRFYPATEWSDETYDDSLDFRIRSWYIEAISSAKDIIILLDNSGSMTGFGAAVATQAVNAILDTLTDNDYVNIFTFNNVTKALVNCFNDTLVQANEENLRLLREQVETIKYHNVTDISKGLEKAFSVLWNYRSARRGGIVCNQAIMLITEGVNYTYWDNELSKILNIYNYLPDQKYYRPIRVFTYLLGIELQDTDSKRMKWVACANMGYYVNLTTVEEIREKVLKYLEVLSRPINLSPEIEPKPAWTALYVHLADRRLSNWLWKKNEGNRQRDILIQYETAHMQKEGLTVLENTTHFTQGIEHDYARYLEFPDYQYLTSVSLPVFNLREKKGSLLGVAGVDVPLDFVKQLAEPHRIGVNGYSFTITNNGYVLHHPDHRTEFANHILKPTFNRVDVTEVEISDDTHEPRQFDRNIIDLRHNIVLQNKGSRILRIRAPIDDMKRVMLGRRHYFYTPIGPFSMVIALPDGYGFLVSRMEVSAKQMARIKHDLRTSLKKNTKWRVHPKWLYTCNTTRADKSPEKELLHFLNTNATDCKEQDLVNALLKDVHVTEWWHNTTEAAAVLKHVKQKTAYYEGVVLTFMATHAGLTRWKDLRKLKKVKHFADKHNKATDEIYYRRGAEMNYNRTHKDMFILSVPFEAYDENTTLITASHVIFREKDRKRAPIAAVGYQILHRTLNKILQTFTCGQPICKISCAGPDAWICYVIDNDAYIILADNTANVGKSLADVEVALMKTLVKDGIFKEITVFDYQATCFPNYTSPNPFYSFFKKGDLYNIDMSTCHQKFTPIQCKTIEYLRLQLKKTTPTPCDMELRMYNYQFRNMSHLHPDLNHRDCPCPYITEPIRGTNLLLLALDKKCCDMETASPKNDFPREIEYSLKLPCHIAVNNNFTKRHYTNCITNHSDEYMLNVDTRFCGSEGIVPLE